MPTKKAPTKKSATKTVAKKATANKQSDKKAAPKKAVAKKKSVVKKAATKKITPKSRKATTAKKSAKDLVFASDDQSFWVTNGDILNSLEALHAALDAMPREVFEFHATGPQNDFSIWVETVLCDADCAADLAKAKSQKSAKTTVAKHLKSYAK